MKRLHNYILLSVLAFAFASCSEDEVIDINGQGQVAGDISFGLSLPEVSSRTVYGKEADNAFPIYWVDGDKVQVFSPQGLDGRKSAEYVVSTKDENGNVVTDLNYASNLTKTGANGVQWGTSEYHDFYSLYPSGNYTLSSDGLKAENITINNMQHIEVKDGVVKSDMEDCLMYAKTTGVAKGEVVNLQYNPITTVLMVTVKVGENQTGTDPDKFTIQNIKLEADTDIAGTFSLNISDGSFGEFTKASKIVQAEIVNNATGGFHSISNKESFEIPLFLAPTFTVNEDGTVKAGPNVKNWKISILANGNIYTKTLDIDKTLTPGQIHKITLPELKPATTEWEVSKWMTYIPRNVYLSEVSIPGSWNTLNKEFQGATPTISGQYANGVRAFHLDTRWQGGGSAVRPTIKNTLGVANGGSTVEYTNNGRVMTDDDNPSVEKALDEIIKNIKPDEYMVLMCTFAQGSHNHSYTDDNGTSYDWAGEISRICSIKEAVYDAKNLTANTLVGDVLGKVIVIVKMEGAFTVLPTNSKCLFINAPLKLTSNLFGTTLSDTYNKTDINKGTTNATTVSDTFIDIYHTQAQVCLSGETYTDSRDRNDVDGRGFAPTFGERKIVANNILDWSKKNYGNENYTHDKWIYLGLGGYYMEYNDGFFGIGAKWEASDNGHKLVASDMNSWINNKVLEMGTKPQGQTSEVPYYPVGIILMNFTNDYASTVKNILLLNNKYRLQYDPNKGADYTPTQTTQVVSKANYDSTVNDGGNLIGLD